MASRRQHRRWQGAGRAAHRRGNGAGRRGALRRARRRSRHRGRPSRRGDVAGRDRARRVSRARRRRVRGNAAASGSTSARGGSGPRCAGRRCNTGDMMAAALAAGAAPNGDWTTCHSVAWDAWSPQRERPRAHQPADPPGLPARHHRQRRRRALRRRGRRLPQLHLRQVRRAPSSSSRAASPSRLFDATTRPLLRTEEYDMPGVSVVDRRHPRGARRGASGSTPAAPRRDGRRVQRLRSIVAVPFDPAVKDGRRRRVEPPKSNWASRWRRRRSTRSGHVRDHVHVRRAARRHRRPGADTAGAPIEGLFVCGEMLGGLFSGNYPGGTGLAAGAVFGRRAGTVA